MPTADGRFKGISVPRLPWHDDREAIECCPGCPDVEYCGSVGCAVGASKASVVRDVLAKRGEAR